MIPLEATYVTEFEKTLCMGSTCNLCNACFWYLGSKTIKVQILSYPCQRTLLTVAVVYTEPIAKGVNRNSRTRAIIDTARFIELLNIDSPFLLLRLKKQLSLSMMEFEPSLTFGIHFEQLCPSPFN